MKSCPSRFRWSRLGVLLAVMAGLAPFAARGQLRIAAELDRDRYLPYETVVLTITLQNDSGNDLLFDHSQSSEAHLSVSCRGRKMDVPFVELLNPTSDDAFRLGAGQRRQMTYPLHRRLPIQVQDFYELSVQIGHPLLDRDYRSRVVRFEIRTGLTLWAASVGVPANPLAGEGQPIRLRQASILAFSGANTDYYVLKIEDAERVYSIERLAPRISSDPPVVEVDARSNLHIILRLSSRIYSYRVYDWRGRLLQNRFLAIGDERPPILVRDSDRGMVTQVGGRLARPGEDYEVRSDGGVVNPER